MYLCQYLCQELDMNSQKLSPLGSKTALAEVSTEEYSSNSFRGFTPRVATKGLNLRTWTLANHKQTWLGQDTMPA